MAHDVFISYSSEDKKVADAVCAALEEVKIRCWIAPRDVLVGEKWPEAIADAIEKSHIMVLIFSSHSNNSKDVSKELVLAMNVGVTVIPLRIEEVQPKGVMKYYLSDTHWIDALNPPTKNQIDNIVETVSLLVYKKKVDSGKQNKYLNVDEDSIAEKEKGVSSKRVKPSKFNKLAIILGSILFIVVVTSILTYILINKNNNEINITESSTSEIEITQKEIVKETETTATEQTIENTPESEKSETATTTEADGISSIIGSCDTPGNANEVYIDGDYAYIADGNAGLQIIDITDKKNPDIIATCDTPDDAWGVYVEGNYAYIVGNGLQIIDITDKKNPNIISSASGGPEGIYIKGNYAYTSGDDDLLIMDITNKVNPYPVGSYNLSSEYIIKNNSSDATEFAWDIYVEGNYAFIAVGSRDKITEMDGRGLQIIDITDKKNPDIVGVCKTSGNAWGVFVEGNYAYVVDINRVLQIIDITDKQNPKTIGSCPGGWDIYVEGNYAYTNNNSDFQIIDITDKNNPVIIGTCGTPGDVSGIFVEGKYAYIADNEAGLQIIDTSIREN